VTIRDTISGPLAWLLIGWITREAGERFHGADAATRPLRMWPT
jgi:hypothetical protein